MHDPEFYHLRHIITDLTRALILMGPLGANAFSLEKPGLHKATHQATLSLIEALDIASHHMNEKIRAIADEGDELSAEVKAVLKILG